MHFHFYLCFCIYHLHDIKWGGRLMLFIFIYANGTYSKNCADAFLGKRCETLDSVYYASNIVRDFSPLSLNKIGIMNGCWKHVRIIDCIYKIVYTLGFTKKLFMLLSFRKSFEFIHCILFPYKLLN